MKLKLTALWQEICWRMCRYVCIVTLTHFPMSLLIAYMASLAKWHIIHNV